MQTVQSEAFPTLREYLAAGFEHPAVDPATFHDQLAEVLVHDPVWRAVAVGEAIADKLAMHHAFAEHGRAQVEALAHDPDVEPAMRAWAFEGMIAEEQFAGWLVELAADEDLVAEVIDALPRDLVEYNREAAIAETRPFVLEVDHDRERWICTATGREGSGPVAVIRPRMGDAAGDLKGYEAVVSLEALREAVEVIEDLNADDLG